MDNRIDITNERAKELIDKYGSPLYVYDEKIISVRCQEMKGILKDVNFKPNYSAKANTNLEILKLIKDEGLSVDAMSPGEIMLEIKAGFNPKEILFISNNVTKEEMQFAIEKGVMISVDSLSQLQQYGELNPGGKVAIRVNPGIGDGHSDKVITAGKSKFGIELGEVDKIKEILKQYNLVLIGINQHIGSLFLKCDNYINACKILLEFVQQFENLEFVDLGGGFGVPYKDESRLDLEELNARLQPVVEEFISKYSNKNIRIKTEPGRYIVAEAGVLLGKVTSVKTNYGEKYVGTDIGFNVLMRPVMYDSYHGINIYNNEEKDEIVTLVGNICESGDILAKNRNVKKTNVGDIIGIENAGAYGYCMSSNYNSRLRPAEILIQKDGSIRLIRRRDTLEDLLAQYEI